MKKHENNMKMLFLIGILLALSFQLFTQNSFETIIDEPGLWETAYSIKEVGNSRYVLDVSREISEANHYIRRYQSLYLLDSQGQILDNDSIIIGDTLFFNSWFIPVGDNGLLCTGAHGVLNENFVFQLKGAHICYYDLSNDQFDLQWIKRHHYYNNNGEVAYWTTMPITKPGTDSCFIGLAYEPNSENYIFSFSALNGDSLLMRQVDAPVSWYPAGLLFSTDNPNLHMHFRLGTFSLYSNLLVRFDDQYETITDTLLTTGTNLRPWYSKAMQHANGNIYLAGEATWHDWQTGAYYRHFGVFSYDSDYNLVNSIYLTHPDTNSQTAWGETMDINSEGAIYIASNYFFHGSPFSGAFTYLYLAKLDADLNLIWEKYIGGDRYYSTSVVSATSDGGVIVSGYGYDKDFPETRGFAWICKFDADGIVGTSEHILPVKAALVYPNPASGYVDIQSNHQHGIVRIYDISGRLLHEELSKPGTHRIDLTRLKSGTYVVAISVNNIQIHKQLIIKQ
jgi:hypothetical protein